MKRILATALVLALAVSLLPTAFALTGWETDQKFVYEFSQAAHGISHSGNASVLSSTYDQSIGKTAEGYLPWGYVGVMDRASVATTTTTATAPNALLWTFYLDTVTEDVNGVTSVKHFDPESSKNQRALMLEIEIKEDGLFRPEIEYAKNNASVIMEYHLVKKKDGEKGYDGEKLSNYVKKLTSSTRLGVVDQSSGDGSAKFATVTLEKGNYYLVAIPVGSNPNCKFVRNSATASSNPNRAYAVNHLKKFIFTRAYEASEEVVFDYTFTSQSFNLQSVQLVNGDEADEGYLGYWGKDNDTDNPDHRTSYGGWVGNSMSVTTAATLRNSTTYGADAHKFMNKEKTAPWKFYSRGHNNVYIDSGRAYMNCTARNGNSAVMIFELEIPVTGKYKLDLKGTKGETPTTGNIIQGADGAVYFVKADSVPENSLLTADTRIGSYKFYEKGLTGTKNTTETMEKSAVVEEAGTYYVVVQLRKDEGAKEFSNSVAPEGTTTTEFATHYLGRVRGMTLTRTGLLDEEITVDAEREEQTEVDGGNVTPEDINVST